MERAMGIEQIQTAKTRRYCPLFNSIGAKWSQGDAKAHLRLYSRVGRGRRRGQFISTCVYRRDRI